ncbi:Snf1 kinase complex beta-subunit Gal83 [Penicillium chermesinum]|nr:Snf1 kinase complex beta-subunit Gal83 [Penicillium chermesinum]
MGNNPSKPDEESSGHVQNPPHDRKVARRTSLNAIPTSKATAADPSATKETAAGHSAAYQGSVQQRLRSRNSTDSPSRNVNRTSEDKKAAPVQNKDTPSPDHSNPVQVPTSRHAAGAILASTHLQRPPRMPLPIGDATTTPGSPISGPEDSLIQSMPADLLLDDQMPAGSRLSSNTLDGDEMGDELQPFGTGKAISTVIEWSGPGDKVYVTGTFVNWEKKFKLHRKEGESVMSTTLNLRPGTHHLKFLVNGDMRASDNLPTAVDFTNHLVNYIEISADDDEKPTTPAGTPAQEEPSKGRAPEDTEDNPLKKEEVFEEVPPGDFGNFVPQFLADLDKEEDSPAYLQAANVIGDTPTPPSLPLFLGKPILNSTTPTKDDSSVLNYPNHTVLNHLATSSIKNGVLATSVTTRYKRKYVTSILYKPTGDITG